MTVLAVVLLALMSLAACSGDDMQPQEPLGAGGSMGAAGTANVAGTAAMAGTAAASGGTGASVGMSGGTGAAGMSGGTMAPPTGGTAVGGMMAGTMAPPMAGTAAAGTMAPVTGGTAAAGMGAPPDTMVVDPSSCPPAPAGADAQAIAALDIVHSYRLPAGAGCVTMVAEIIDAAQNHCDYYAGNSGMCTDSPHNEVMGCTGFTGEGPGDRMRAAGYTSRGGSEVMAFNDDPQRAIDMWVNSVWHRLPILDPWTTDLGYGHADGCDTIDFGSGTLQQPDDAVVVYPYDGQVDVPVSFDGRQEGPMPPAPPTGWPSASPINVYAREYDITEHVLTLDGDDTAIEHVWLTREDESGFLRNAVMMYANAPFEPLTTYRVRIVGTYVGGTLDLEWTFTTGEARRFGF